jgi:hypothetical protein
MQNKRIKKQNNFNRFSVNNLIRFFFFFRVCVKSTFKKTKMGEQKRRVPIPLAGDDPTLREIEVLRGCESRTLTAWGIGAAAGAIPSRFICKHHPTLGRVWAMFLLRVSSAPHRYSRCCACIW